MKKSLFYSISIACLCITFGCLAVLDSNLSYAGPNHLKYKNNKLSADLKDAPLQNVFNYLNKENGLWVEGKNEISGKKVSVKFADLPLVEGVRRLLISIDYALIFDRKGELIGVVIISGDTKGSGKTKGQPPAQTIAEMPPLGDNVMPPSGDDTMPPPATMLPPVPKGDAQMPPPAKMLPPQVSKKVMEIMKKSDKMPPVSGNLPPK